MLDANLKNQLKAYLEKVTQPFEIVASLDDGAKSQELLGLLEDISSLSDKITLYSDGQYLVNTMTKGWKRKANVDLWSRLDALVASANRS